MQFTTTTVVAALGLASLATAAPVLQARQCGNFPWFIAPYADSQTCGGSPATYQPTSGPYNPNAVSTGCTSLSDPNGTPQGFQSVSINRDACPQQQWQIQLYTDAACATDPVVVNTDSCVPSPGTDSASLFQSFEAILLQ